MKIFAKSRTISLIIGLVLLTLILPGAVSAASTSSLNAQVISTTIPSSIVTGQSYPVSVTMKNTGSMTWNEGSIIRLGASTDGSGDAALFAPDRIKIPSGTSVPHRGPVHVLFHHESTFKDGLLYPEIPDGPGRIPVVWR